MRTLSRIKSEVGTVAEIGADFTHDDERLARRWKRRCIAHQNCSKSPKKIIKKGNQENVTDTEMVTIDSDYENYLNDIELLDDAEDVDSVDDNVNCDGPLNLVGRYDSDILDPQYMMFLDNLKVDGNAYVLTLPLGNHTPLVVQYEKEDDNAPRRKNMEARNKFRNIPMIDRKVPVVEKNVEMEPDNFCHCTTNDCECDLMDESYQCFLKSLEVVDQNLVYAPEGGEKVVFEKGEASDSDSEVILLDANLFSDEDYNIFALTKPHHIHFDVDDEGCIERLAGSKESEFRKKLMEILQKPYDPKEHDDLLQEASKRRPLEKIKVLRGIEKNWILDPRGKKSYLEEHSDFREKICGVHDKHRVLNVLRGFFYWLKNLTVGEAFKPWLDASCLEALPRA